MVEELQQDERYGASCGDMPRGSAIEKTYAESYCGYCGGELRKIVHGYAGDGMGVAMLGVMLPREDEETVEAAERGEECGRWDE